MYLKSTQARGNCWKS